MTIIPENELILNKDESQFTNFIKTKIDLFATRSEKRGEFTLLKDTLLKKDNCLFAKAPFQKSVTGINSSLKGVALDFDWFKQFEASKLAFYKAINDLKDPVLTLDFHLNFTFINKTGLTYFDKDQKKLIGQNIEAILPDIDWNSVYHSFRKWENENDPLYLEVFSPRLNQWFGCRIYPILQGFTVLFFDITGQKFSEKKLIDKEKKYETLINNMTDVVFTLDLNLNMTYVSPSVEKQLGESVEDNMKRKIEDKIPPRYLSELKQLLATELEKETKSKTPSQKIYEFETEHINADGSVVWLYLSLSFIRNEAGIINGIQGVSYDITHRKNVELELQQSAKLLTQLNTQLIQLNSSLNKKNQELNLALSKAEESERLKSAFLANMSHEIRTPLNGILGFAEMLKDPEIGENMKEEYIDIIQNCGNRLLGIINNVMDISKIEAKLVKLLISKINIGEQFKFLYNFFSPEAQKKGISLSYTIPDQAENLVIFSDKIKFEALLTNLIKNSIKFTESGSIEFGFSINSDDSGIVYCFYVKDTGIGISEDQQHYIFERFRQCNETLTKTIEGTGLGLAISKAYVEMLGGRIWVESISGKGSCFYFTLPDHQINTTNYTNEHGKHALDYRS